MQYRGDDGGKVNGGHGGTSARLSTTAATAKVNAKPVTISRRLSSILVLVCVSLFLLPCSTTLTLLIDVDSDSDIDSTRARPTHRTPLLARPRRHPRPLPPSHLHLLHHPECSRPRAATGGTLHHGYGRARAQDRQGRVRACTRRRAGQAFQGASGAVD